MPKTASEWLNLILTIVAAAGASILTILKMFNV